MNKLYLVIASFFIFTASAFALPVTFEVTVPSEQVAEEIHTALASSGMIDPPLATNAAAKKAQVDQYIKKHIKSYYVSYKANSEADLVVKTAKVTAEARF